MKITDVKLHTLEHPTLTQIRYRFKQVPGLRRIQYTHTRRPTETPMKMQILEVETDEGITGRIAPTSINKYQLAYPQNPRHRRKPLRPRTALPDAA